MPTQPTPNPATLERPTWHPGDPPLNCSPLPHNESIRLSPAKCSRPADWVQAGWTLSDLVRLAWDSAVHPCTRPFPRRVGGTTGACWGRDPREAAWRRAMGPACLPSAFCLPMGVP